MATYYVDPVSGNNANAGTSFGTAWKTTQFAADTAVALDTVLLCATGVESISVGIDFDTNFGNITSSTIQHIYFIGANSSGVVDGTKYEIKLTANGVQMLRFTSATVSYVWFENVKINGDGHTTSIGVYCSQVNGSGYVWFMSCEFTGLSGGTTTNGNNNWYFVNTEFHNNVTHVFTGSGRGGILAYGSSFHDASSGGISLTGNSVLVSCSIYNNTNNGIGIGQNGSLSQIFYCTISGNSGDGINLGLVNGRGGQFVGNTISLNGGYGMSSTTAARTDLNAYNNVYGNTSGNFNYTTDMVNLVGGDPLFTDLSTGDLAPLAGSSLLAAGPGGTTLGALSALPGGGGSSLSSFTF